MSSPRALSRIGWWGAALTIVILAMSVLLRLGTELEGGAAVSTLPPGVEEWARIGHRLAAMAVGVLAALALVTAWRSEVAPRPSAPAVAAIVGLTALLAVIGRYTPGYRVDLVTAANVAGGVALAAAFWVLRSPARAGTGDAVARAALLALLLAAALGAAVDVAAMRGERAFGPLHMWVAAAFFALSAAVAWRQRRRPALAAALALLTLAQVGLGFALLSQGGARPLALGWLHAMGACALALVLVSAGCRERRG